LPKGSADDALNEAYIQRECRIEQIRLAAQLDQFDEILLSSGREFAALLAWIRVGAEPDLGDETRALARYFAQPLHARANRPTVSFDPVLANETHELRTGALRRMQRIHV
jgi:hypothetical protein